MGRSEKDMMWLERTAMLVGEEALMKLRNARVAIVGTGGVGAYAAEMLTRAGVGNLIIIDSDLVSLSNKNRQLLALDSTIGCKKVDVLRNRLLDINSELNIESYDYYLDEENIPTILEELGRIDYLVDAIDTLAPKIKLIQTCVETGIKHVSSMGAGAKYDISSIRIKDLSKSFNCPLAYILRKKLRKLGINKGFKVVFSEELPDRSAIVEVEGERNKKSQVGTISYIPAVFGCACAQAAIEYLITDKLS